MVQDFKNIYAQLFLKIGWQVSIQNTFSCVRDETWPQWKQIQPTIKTHWNQQDCWLGQSCNITQLFLSTRAPMTLKRTSDRRQKSTSFKKFYWFEKVGMDESGFVFPLMCGFICCFLCVPRPGFKIRTMAYQDDTQTNWAISPGWRTFWLYLMKMTESTEDKYSCRSWDLCTNWSYSLFLRNVSGCTLRRAILHLDGYSLLQHLLGQCFCCTHFPQTSMSLQLTTITYGIADIMAHGIWKTWTRDSLQKGWHLLQKRKKNSRCSQMYLRLS